MPTKTKQKKSVESLERDVKLAQAALHNARADLLELEDKAERLDVERAAISVKTAGSRTAAVRSLEEVEKREAGLKHSLTLATAAMSECEEDVERAEDAFSEAVREEQEGAPGRGRDSHPPRGVPTL